MGFPTGLRVYHNSIRQFRMCSTRMGANRETQSAFEMRSLAVVTGILHQNILQFFSKYF